MNPRKQRLTMLGMGALLVIAVLYIAFDQYTESQEARLAEEQEQQLTILQQELS